MTLSIEERKLAESIMEVINKEFNVEMEEIAEDIQRIAGIPRRITIPTMKTVLCSLLEQDRIIIKSEVKV